MKKHRSSLASRQIFNKVLKLCPLVVFYDFFNLHKTSEFSLKPFSSLSFTLKLNWCSTYGLLSPLQVFLLQYRNPVQSKHSQVSVRSYSTLNKPFIKVYTVQKGVNNIHNLP